MVSAPPPVSLDRDRQPSASPQRIYNFYSPPQNGASRSTVLVHGPQRCLVCQQTGGRRRFMHCLDGGCGEHFQAGCKTSGVRQPKTSFELLIGCNVKCCVTQGTRPGLESNLLNCSHGTTASLHKLATFWSSMAKKCVTDILMCSLNYLYMYMFLIHPHPFTLPLTAAQLICLQGGQLQSYR